MMYELPKCVELGGMVYEIRSDYRAALDICAALSDEALQEMERYYVALFIFYPDFEEIPQQLHQEALEKCFWFISMGDENNDETKPRLIDWEQDFMLIVSPVNRIAGTEVRALKYLHWWTFLSYYYEIGDCLFANVVSIRSKKAKRKKLDKSDQEFYKQNRRIIDLKQDYRPEEHELLAKWGVK